MTIKKENKSIALKRLQVKLYQDAIPWQICPRCNGDKKTTDKYGIEKASYKPGDFVSYEHTDGETYKGEIQEVKSEDDVSVPGSDGIVASTSEEDPSALINVYEVSEDGSYKSTNNYHSHNISSLTPIKSLKNMNSDVMDDGAIGAPDTTPDLGIELSTNETEKAKLPTSRRDDLPDSSFAYVSPDGKTRKMPIHDASHVRNAIARFNQADIPASAKGKAWKKILAAAKKFSVEVSEEHAPKSFKEVIGNFVTKVGEYKVKLAEADFDSLLPVLFTKYTDEARISPTMFAKLTATVLPTVDLEPSVSMYATLSPNASIDKYLGDVGVGNHDYGQELNMDYEEPGEEEDEPEEDNPVAEAVEESEERQAAYAQWQKVSQACWAASDVFSDNPDHFQEVLADLVEVLNSLMIGKSKFKAELVDKEDIVKFGEGKTMTYKEAFTYVLDSFTKEINTHNKVQEELTKKIEGLTSEVTHYKSKPVYKETLKYVQHASNPDGEDNGINKTSGKVLNQTLQTFLYDSAFDVEKKYSEDEAVEFYKNKKGLSADLFQPIQTIRSCFKS